MTSSPPRSQARRPSSEPPTLHPPPAKWNRPSPAPPAPLGPPAPPAPVVALADVAALLVVIAPPAPPDPLTPVTVKQLPATQIPARPAAVHGVPSSLDRTTHPIAATSHALVSHGSTEGQLLRTCAHFPPLQASSVHTLLSSHELPSGGSPFSSVQAPSFRAPLATVHAWQGPALHIASQQTLSTQKPRAHCAALEHARPGGSLAAQEEPAQY